MSRCPQIDRSRKKEKEKYFCNRLKESQEESYRASRRGIIMVREIEKKGKKKIKENNWKKITTIAKNEREILFFFLFPSETIKEF